MHVSWLASRSRLERAKECCHRLGSTPVTIFLSHPRSQHFCASNQTRFSFGLFWKPCDLYFVRVKANRQLVLSVSAVLLTGTLTHHVTRTSSRSLYCDNFDNMSVQHCSTTMYQVGVRAAQACKVKHSRFPSIKPASKPSAIVCCGLHAEIGLIYCCPTRTVADDVVA